MEYTTEAIKNLSDDLDTANTHSGKFSFSILNADQTPGEIGMPPVLEILRAMDNDNPYSLDSSERIAKYCLMGKITILKYDDKEIGRFVINDMDNSWDSFDVFRAYPLALQFILNTCAGIVIKKSIPPRIKNISA